MITVFTPTYNRVNLLDRLYQSLLKQTSYNFEWIVVDDGSTDTTEEYFMALQKVQNPFPIKYIKTPNGGKHRAINKGVTMASGELFFVVDSDDYLTQNAIERLLSWQKSVCGLDNCAGISGLKGYTIDKIVGGNFNEKYVDAKNTERERFNLNGDKAEAYFTDVLRKYPFPEIDGENFITEEVVWNKIALEGYFLRWFNEIIYICEYIEGGLTCSGNAKYINNPQGVLIWAKQQLVCFKKNFKRKASAICRYYDAVIGKKTKKQIARDLGISSLMCTISVLIVKIKRKIRKG